MDGERTIDDVLNSLASVTLELQAIREMATMCAEALVTIANAEDHEAQSLDLDGNPIPADYDEQREL